MTDVKTSLPIPVVAAPPGPIPVSGAPKPANWEPPFVNIPVIDYLSVTTAKDGDAWAVTVLLDNERDATRFHNAIEGKLVRLAGTPVTDANGAPVIDAETGRQKMINVKRVAVDLVTNQPILDPANGCPMTIEPTPEPVAEADAVMVKPEPIDPAAKPVDPAAKPAV